MSIDFGGEQTARMDTSWTPTASEANAGTMLAWVTFREVTGGPRIWSAGAFTGTEIECFNQTGLSGLNLWLTRKRGTTNLVVGALKTSFQAYVPNRWMFVAIGWDTAAADGAQYFLMGNEEVMAREPTTYTDQVAGSGTTGAPSNTFRVGNSANTGSDARSWADHIARFAWIPTRLSIAEAQNLRLADDWNVSSPYVLYDLHSTSHLTDLSGNGRHGTMVGTGYTDGPDPALGVRNPDFYGMHKV